MRRRPLWGFDGTYLPTSLIEKHIDELKSAADAVETYVDRRIAHHDHRATDIPTFSDLSTALATMENLVLLYVRLLQGPAIMGLLPTVQFEWKSIFHFPWVEPHRVD